MEWVGFAVVAFFAIAWICDSTDLFQSRTRSQARLTPPPASERGRRRHSDGRPRGYYYGWWEDMLKAHGYHCYYCGLHIARGMHKEHVIPLSRGGPHDIKNIKPACARCNLIKGTLTGAEFLELINSNGGTVPLTRSKKCIPKERPAPLRRLILQAIARLQVRSGPDDGWSVDEILEEVRAADSSVNLNSLRATISMMGARGLLERVKRGRYRLPS